jgi:exodeoxyribonuclease VII small subunit
MSESFEDAARRLGEIVEELEAGDLPLERSLALFEEGVRLARTAQERLDRAERRVEELLGVDANGKAVTRELPLDPKRDPHPRSLEPSSAPRGEAKVVTAPPGTER